MEETKVGYLDRPEVTESFADHCERVIFDGQTLRIELAVTRYTAPVAGKATGRRRTTASRLVLTPQCGLQLFEQLARVVAAMDQKGLLRKVQDPATKQ